MTDASRAPERRKVFHYSHHSTGLGHLVRSLSVARAMAEQSELMFCSGGPVPAAMPVPPGIHLVALPPIGTDEHGRLASLDPSHSLEEAWEARRRLLLQTFEDFDPDALVVELFPFGRRKFAGELIALLEMAREGRRRAVISSVRDVLVDAHPDKQSHDDEAARRLDAYFDAVIVHGDPVFARLEETFRPVTPPNVPVYYSGFVAPATPVEAGLRRPGHLLVSAGGGRIGSRLLETAVESHRSVLAAEGVTTHVVTGPFLSDDVYSALTDRARGVERLKVERFVPNLASAMAESTLSVSQCGYNTSIDLLRTGVPAIVVPYDQHRETEQWARACRLESLGLVKVLPMARLSVETLADAVLEAMAGSSHGGLAGPGDGPESGNRTVPRRQPVRLDLNGAAKTADLVASLMSEPALPAP